MQHFNRDDSDILLENIIENTQMIVFGVDKDHTITMANSMFISLIKSTYNLDISIGANLKDLFNQTYPYSKSRNNIEQALQGQTTIEEGQSQLFPQSNRYFKTTYCPVRDSRGEIIGGAVYSRETTDVEESAAALKESMYRYTLLAKNISDIIIVTDLNLILSYASPSITGILGYLPEEVTGKNVSEFITRESFNTVTEVLKQKKADALQEIAPTYPTVDIEAIRKDGSILWMEIKATWIKDANGPISGVIGVLRDINERRRLQTELIKQHHLLKCMADGTPNYAYVKDVEGRYQLANRKMASAFDYSPHEMEGKTDDELNKLPADFKALNRHDMEVIRTGKETLIPEEKFTLRSGEELYFQISRIPLLDNNGACYGVVMTAANITSHKHLQQKILEMATHDTLTGLPNRTLLDDRLQLALVQAKRKANKLAVLMLDMDNFKKINDSMGHSTGDELLKAVSHRMQETIRESDTVSRFGGDEFIILLPEISGSEEASEIAQRLVKSFHEPFLLSKGLTRISVSIGISIYPQHGNNSQDLLLHADTAMYEVKEHGRNGFRFYTGS